MELTHEYGSTIKVMVWTYRKTGGTYSVVLIRLVVPSMQRPGENDVTNLFYDESIRIQQSIKVTRAQAEVTARQALANLYKSGRI